MKDKVFAFRKLKEQIKKQALSRLESGKLKDTVDQYKKRLMDPEAVAQRKHQVSRYLRKAQDLTVKDVFSDVQNLWNEHLGDDPQSKDPEQFLVDLIQSQNQQEIQQQLKKITIEQIDQQYPLFSKVLGALMLTGKLDLEPCLPAESAFIAHFKTAQEVLACSLDDSPEQLKEIIKKIPYHSAFRDFRILMNAALAMPFLTRNELRTCSRSLRTAASCVRTERRNRSLHGVNEDFEHRPSTNGSGAVDLVQVLRLLNKISGNSPYFQAAKALLAIVQDETGFTQNLMFFNSQSRNIIAEIKGFNQQQRQFIEELAKLRQPLSAEEKFSLVIQFQGLLEKPSRQPFCLAMLGDYPEGIQEIKEHFFSDNEFEQHRVQALLAEQDGNIETAEFFWRQCIKELEENNADNRLNIALILRHLATLLPESERPACLVESLQYDADDRECFIQILNHFCQKSQLDENQQALMEQAVKQFPEDIEILGLAIQISTNIKHKQKTREYAQKILAIDSLNSFAKQALVKVKVELIRSCLQNKDFQHARNAIQQLKALKLNKPQLLQIQLLEAFLYFVEQDKQQGLEKTACVFASGQYDPVNAHFLAAMEAQLAGLPVTTILNALPPVKDHLLTTQSFEQLIKTISRYHEDEANAPLLYKSLEKIKPPLKQSLQQFDDNENLLLTFCELLTGIQHYQLLRFCTKLALKNHPKPVWGVYSVVAETENNPERCSIQQYLALKSDLSNARRRQDHRTVLQLEHYLEQYLEAHPQQNLDMIEDALNVNEADFQEDIEGPMEQLFGAIPEREFSLLNKEMDKLAKKISPEQLVERLCPKHKQSTILSALMNDPDLYTAMLVLLAAEKLDIETGVTMKQVLDCFAVNQQ